jgi:hypothetical protein
MGKCNILSNETQDHDCEPCKVCPAVKRWMANSQNVDCRLGRGSLQRLVDALVARLISYVTTYQSMTRLSVF